MALARRRAEKKGEYNLVAITEAVVASAIGVRGLFLSQTARKGFSPRYTVNAFLQHPCALIASLWLLLLALLN